MVSKNVPREVKIRVTKEFHKWAKESAAEKGVTLTVFLRDALNKFKEQSEFQERYGISDQLIQEVAKKVASEVPHKSGT